MAEIMEEHLCQGDWRSQIHIPICQTSCNRCEGISTAKIWHVCSRIVHIDFRTDLPGRPWQKVLQCCTCYWECLPEETIDPLPIHNSRDGIHSDCGNHVRENNCWDDRLGFPDICRSIVCCCVVLEWRLYVVEEEVNWSRKCKSFGLC